MRIGLDYEMVLWLIKSISEGPGILHFSPDYTFGAKERNPLDKNKATRIRNAVDREWKDQHGKISPSPPRMWWKNPDWEPSFKDVNERSKL